MMLTAVALLCRKLATSFCKKLSAIHREALPGWGSWQLVAAAALPAGSLFLQARGLRFSEASTAAGDAATGDRCAPTTA
jgi:hypothetical protein